MASFQEMLKAAQANKPVAAEVPIVQQSAQVTTPTSASVLELTQNLGFNLPEGLGKPGSGTSASVPLTAIERLEAKITSLQEQLQVNAPGYAGLLHEIHSALAQDESLVHLLKEERIGVIVAGLSKRKAIVIADAVKNKSSSKALSKLGADDF